MKLKHRLIIAFLSIALIPLAIASFIASYIANQSLEQQAFAQLISVREIKKAQISSYFAERKGDIEVLALTVKKLLSASTQDAVKTAHNHHDYFAQFINSYGYYDLFLIDQSGDVFYTVTKEADYQSNLRTGLYADSGLGQLFRTVTTKQSFAMVDFSRYAPSNNEPASFIAIPVNLGQQKLTLALQLSIESINHIMQQREGMGKTGESYLVGSDYLMRSDSFLDPNGHSVKASFAGNVAQNGVDTEATRLALGGEAGTKIIIDYNNNPVLSAYTPLTVNGIQWALLSEIDVAEAFEAINKLSLSIILVVLFCLIIVIAVALFIAKSITKPLGGEPNAMQNLAVSIAQGDLTTRFEQETERSGVYQAMYQMSQRLLAMISDIIDNSNTLASSSEECSVASLQTSKSLNSQQQNIEQLTNLSCA